MHEHFLIELEAHDLTKKIFRESVEMIRHIQKKFLADGTFTNDGAWSAAQALVTLNYNYVLHAMAGFPSNYSKRHHLIADILEVALKR